MEGAPEDAPTEDVAQRDDDSPQTRATLRFSHALGFSGGTDNYQQGRRLIDHINDDNFVYLAGKHVAVYSYDSQKAHRFILKNPKTSRIVAFCVSANRRYIALSEVIHPEPSGGIQVSVYNFSTASKVRELGRGRFPSSTDGYQPPVVALDFSRDNKYLATVTDPPNPYIYLWQLDKQRLAGMAEVHQKVSQISISPWAHWELCTTGTSMLKLWRAQGNQLKSYDPLSKEKVVDYKFTCHSWFDSDKLVVGTADGCVLVIENQELKKIIEHVDGGISCISSVSRGFICGGVNGNICLYERSYDAQYFSCFKVVQCPEKLVGSNVMVVDVTISPNEEGVVCCYENNEVIHINLNMIENADDSEKAYNVFRRLPIGFHHDAVTGVDVCVQKSILVTSSLDRHIRVWNFLKKRVEIDKRFDEDVLSVAVHPSGYLLVAGFRFKLCVFVVLANDLQLCHEFPNIKQCREVRFSHGGQYFAAVGNPWSRIVIINAYTFQPLGSRDNPNGAPLTGHSASVQSIWWSANDQSLISAGSEGAIYEWKVVTGKRVEANESVTKSVNYHCVRYDDDSQTLAALGMHKPSGTDRKESSSSEHEITLRTIRFQVEYPPKTQQKTLSKPLSIPSVASPDTIKGHRQPRAVRSCQIAISPLAQTLFVATNDGQLLLYEWPPCDASGDPQPYSKLEVHQGEILFIILSLDERYLFTVGADDRCLFMFDVDIVSEGRPITRRPFPFASFESVAYVSQQEFNERGRYIHELQAHNEDLKRRQQAELAVIQEEHEEELRKVESETLEEMIAMRTAMEQNMKEAEETRLDVQGKEVAMAELHMKSAEELEALHTKRIEEMHKRHRALQDEKDDLVVRYENKMHKLLAEIQSERNQLEQQYKETEQRLLHDVEHLRRNIHDACKNINCTIDLTIQDYMMELDGGPGVEGLHAKWKAIIAEKESQCSVTRTNAALFKTKREKHDREIEELESEIENIKEQERHLAQKAQEHLKTNEALKGEIAQRNETISASERKILELKKQTAELEKLRYVLTYKFSELRKEVAPKEEKIKDMNDSIQEMDLQLERIGTERDSLQQSLGESDTKIQSLMKGLSRQNKLLDDKERMTDQLLRDLTGLVSRMGGDNIVEELNATVDAYSMKYEEEVGTSYENERALEFDRQKQYMESQLTSIDKANRQNESFLRHDNQVKTEENAMLVKEINQMRSEKKLLTQRWQQADSQLKAYLQRQSVKAKESSASRPYSAPVSKARAVRDEVQEQRNLKGIIGRGPVKGRLMKGSTRSLKDIADINPHKLATIVAQVEETNSCIKRQADEVLRLKEYIKELLQSAESAGRGTTLPPVDVSSPRFSTVTRNAFQ